MVLRISDLSLMAGNLPRAVQRQRGCDRSWGGDGKKMYSLPPILLFTVLAMLAGAVSYRQVHAFIQIHLDRLNAVFGVSLRKAPACTTLRFILRGLDGTQLERVFRKHAAGLPAPVADDAAVAAPARWRRCRRGWSRARRSASTSWRWRCICASRMRSATGG